MSNIHSQRRYIIGTRNSALALNQARWVQAQLHAHTGDHFDLYEIETEGDQKLDQALWQIEGKDFFTKELDRVLINKKVDLVVHSYKDLGTQRPQEFMLAAITERANAADLLLVKKSTRDDLKQGKLASLLVGTSSPRRMANLTRELSALLPYGLTDNSQIKIETKILRGNVFTRMKKLLDGQYQAIVLALAGLERLAKDEYDRKQLAPILKEFDLMVLPQTLFPAAAAQGALGIEMLQSELRGDAGELWRKIQFLHHPDTATVVAKERETFKAYGGGCHLGVGIHVQALGPLFIHRHRGEHQGQIIDQQFLEGRDLPRLSLPIRASEIFIGMPSSTAAGTVHDELIEKLQLPIDSVVSTHELGQHYLTTRHAHRDGQQYPGQLFSAGVETWKIMAAKGFWVHGSSEGLGDEAMNNLSDNTLIKLWRELQGIPERRWYYTRKQGPNEENSAERFGERIACYTHQTKLPSSEFVEKMKNIKVAYWPSYILFESYIEHFPSLKNKNVIHACGPGKTYQELNQAGMKPLPFLNLKEFKKTFYETSNSRNE